MKSKLHRRLSKLEQTESLSQGSSEMLVSLLGKLDALFWPCRFADASWLPSLIELRRNYLSRAQGLGASAEGREAWKAAHRHRSELIKQGYAIAVTSSSQVTGLRLTPIGEVTARHLLDIPTRAAAPWMQERLSGGFRYLNRQWVSESELYRLGELHGDSSQWDRLTEFVAPWLTCGAVDCRADLRGRVYYSWNEIDIEPEPEPVSSLPEVIEPLSIYSRAFQSEIVRFRSLESSCEVVIPMRCGGA